MIINLKVSKEQRKALLLRYPDIRVFLESMIFKTAEKIITEQNKFSVEKELAEYHDRRRINNNDIHGRKCSQATRDKISKTLKAKYKGNHYPLMEETKIKIGLAHRGKIVSQATRDKIGKANKGKKRTVEQRERISQSHKGLKYKVKVK